MTGRVLEVVFVPALRFFWCPPPTFRLLHGLGRALITIDTTLDRVVDLRHDDAKKQPPRWQKQRVEPNALVHCIEYVLAYFARACA